MEPSATRLEVASNSRSDLKVMPTSLSSGPFCSFAGSERLRAMMRGRSGIGVFLSLV